MAEVAAAVVQRAYGPHGPFWPGPDPPDRTSSSDSLSLSLESQS